MNCQVMCDRRGTRNLRIRFFSLFLARVMLINSPFTFITFFFRDVLRGDAGSNPARDTNFSFISRDVCQKSLVSYIYIFFIVSKTFMVQIIYILFTTLICRGRAMIHTNVSKEKSPLDWPGSIYSNQ